MAKDSTLDVPAEVIRKANADDGQPISKDRSVMVRMPLSGDIATYLAS